MEQKFVVLKVEDCNKYLDDLGQLALDLICQTVVDGRLEDGKKVNSYMVVNTDEPYAEEVARLIGISVCDVCGKVLEKGDIEFDKNHNPICAKCFMFSKE